MATLQILRSAPDADHPALAEHGEEYDQIHRFRSIDQMEEHLSRLGLPPGLITELRAGNEVEINSELSWPHAFARYLAS